MAQNTAFIRGEQEKRTLISGLAVIQYRAEEYRGSIFRFERTVLAATGMVRVHCLQVDGTPGRVR